MGRGPGTHADCRGRRTGRPGSPADARACVSGAPGCHAARWRGPGGARRGGPTISLTSIGALPVQALDHRRRPGRTHRVRSTCRSDVRPPVGRAHRARSPRHTRRSRARGGASQPGRSSDGRDGPSRSSCRPRPERRREGDDRCSGSRSIIGQHGVSRASGGTGAGPALSHRTGASGTSCPTTAEWWGLRAPCPATPQARTTLASPDDRPRRHRPLRTSPR